MAEPTSTLADTLLDDLDDLSDAEDHVKVSVGKNDLESSCKDDDDEENEMHESVLNNRFLSNVSLQEHLKRIEKRGEESGQDDKNSDYELIVISNQFRNRLNEELQRVHLSLCDVYGRKFPELQDLLANSQLQYKNAVQVIQNEMDLTRVNDRLNDHFNSNQIITMSVASSTTAGRPLTEEELSLCLKLASYMDEVDQVQSRLTRFVEERITGLAPSTCALVGPQVAAQLLGLAGGLQELSQVPACNLQVLGQNKTTAASRAGLSSKAHQPHQGVLANCDLMQNVAPQYRVKLLKQIAGKVALCIRFDAVNVLQGRARTATAGDNYRQLVLDKLRHWQEPDQAPTQKALPKPDLTVKKRRGGKRMRRLKERFEETALMKQANTRSFSAQAGEYGDDAMGLTLGLLDTEGEIGGVRKNATGEKRKMRLANTKQARKQRALAARVSSQQHHLSENSGLASTVTFTPLQAMELVNPDAQKERVRQANQKWFTDNAGFQSALPRKDTGGG